MGIEIERKFLVIDDSWREGAEPGIVMQQGYLIAAKQASVRVRVEGKQARLNIKSMTLGVRRQEFEYPIPLHDAQTLLKTLCARPLIEKVRYPVHYGGKVWEVDVFKGENTGLVVAELELQHEAESFEIPSWLGREVSDDPRYYNTSLVRHPYRDWS
jgi:adenylate cyclase